MLKHDFPHQERAVTYYIQYEETIVEVVLGSASSYRTRFVAWGDEISSTVNLQTTPRTVKILLCPEDLDKVFSRAQLSAAWLPQVPRMSR